MREEAGVLFFYDPFIVVPPGGRASALMRCAIAKEITLLSGVSHMHKRGVGFQAFVDPPSPATDLASTPFYTSSDWNHPNKCSQSFECVQRCPAGTAPKLGGTGVPDVAPCWQKCFAESCPSAGAPLLTNLTCVRTKCGAACTDMTASDCVSCVLQNCRDAYKACNAHVCN